MTDASVKSAIEQFARTQLVEANGSLSNNKLFAAFMRLHNGQFELKQRSFSATFGSIIQKVFPGIESGHSSDGKTYEKIGFKSTGEGTQQPQPQQPQKPPTPRQLPPDYQQFQDETRREDASLKTQLTDIATRVTTNELSRVTDMESLRKMLTDAKTQNDGLKKQLEKQHTEHLNAILDKDAAHEKQIKDMKDYFDGKLADHLVLQKQAVKNYLRDTLNDELKIFRDEVKVIRDEVKNEAKSIRDLITSLESKSKLRDEEDTKEIQALASKVALIQETDLSSINSKLDKLMEMDANISSHVRRIYHKMGLDPVQESRPEPTPAQ